MSRISLIMWVSFISLTAGAIDWPSDMTGAISQQDCLSAFPNGKFVETSIAQNKNTKFNLFYFSAKPIDLKLPTLLYIDGGPGQATGAGVNTLRFSNLEQMNVVYFHPRAIGCSQLPADNQWDFTISTETNAHDIEVIKQSLGISQWSIVFGLSYGTVSGLKYAEMYPSSVEKLVFEGMFNPSLSRDKVSLAVEKGYPTLMSAYQSWPEYKNIPIEKISLINDQIVALFQTGKAVNSKGVALTDQQINTLIVVLFSTTYQGVYSQGSINRNGILNAGNALLKLFFPVAELPALPIVKYDSVNNLPYLSYRAHVNTALNDSLEIDFITELADPSKDLATVIAEFYPDELPYLLLNTLKTYKIIDLPKSLAPHIQFTLLLGTDDGATPYANAMEYLKALQSPYTLYGLNGFGHQRHFDDVCYAQVIKKIYNNEKLDSLFSDKTTSCFLPEGFVR